jgi:hypothetical protein
VLVALLVGVVLLYLAIPRLVVAWHEGPTSPVLRRVHAGAAVSPQELEDLAEHERRAAHWVASGQILDDLGYALLLRAEGPHGFDERLLRGALDAMRAGAGLAPARSDVWTRLAYAEMMADGPTERASRAVEMALGTAPFDPDLLFVRLELGLIAWNGLGDQARQRLAEDVRRAWRHAPRRLIRIGRSTGRIDQVVAALPQGSRDTDRTLRWFFGDL